MRKTNLSAQEVAEMDEFQNKERRASGYALMPERDRGWAVHYDEKGQRVAILWHTEREPQEGEALRKVPQSQVVFEFSGKDGETQSLVFDIDKLKRAVRWA